MTLDSICDWSNPKQIAVEYQDLKKIFRITYAELDIARETIFHHLSEIKSSEFIGISSDVIGYLIPSLILGILGSGHAFFNVPSNTKLSEHLFTSLSARYQFTYHILSAMKVVACVNIHGNDIYLVKQNDINEDIVHDNLLNYAYAISTSGSTGIPKVVKVPHSCILPNILDLKKILCIKESDKIAQFTSLTFDPSIIEIFLALATGATLYMVSQSLKSNANRLLRETYQNQVTVLQMTPSVLLHRWSSQSLKESLLSSSTSLRVLLLGGEPFPRIDVISSCKHVKNTTRIFNIYGITEVSCWASINEIENVSSDPSYLGNLLSQTMFQVRNIKGEIVTHGEGILFIGSNERVCVIDDESANNLSVPVYRNTGDEVYINQGKVYYKRRSTSVVKRFGNKIDLTILERAVLEHDFVNDSYALWEEQNHKLYLCLSISKNKLKDSDLEGIVMNALNKLDPIYRPDRIQFVERFELTTNGKVCMEYLKNQCFQGKEQLDILGKTLKGVEKVFKETWNKYLGTGMNGFIELGGSSLVALQISHSLVKDLNSEFPNLIGMLLNNSTFEDCLKYIRNRVSQTPGNDLIENFKRRQSEVEQTDNSTEVSAKRAMTNQLSMTKTGIDTYQWQKCRGQIYGNTSDLDYANKTETISHGGIRFSYNLKKCVDASPTIFQYSDGNLCATVGSHSGIICTIELTGKLPLTYEIELPDRIESSILILNDFRGIVGCYDHCVYCVDLKTGDIIWKFETGDIVKCTAISSKDGKHIFIGSYDCYAYCLSTKDGAQIWKVKASTGSITASGCLHEPSESILFGTLDGSCVALRQSSGEVFWNRKLSNPIFVAPALLHSGLAVFCTVNGDLTCFNIHDDTEIWNYSIDGNVFAYLLTRHDVETNRETIIVASQNKNVFVLEIKKDDESFKPTLKNIINFDFPIYATPWLNGADLLVACTDGTLSVCKLSETKPKEIVKLPGDIFSSPVVHCNYAFVGCRDDNLYVLELGENAK